jgi:type II secretory pathway pseudopilin PulG
MDAGVSPRSSARAGLTLLELVVVTVLMVAIAAISIPFIGGMLADTRLTAAADMLRARLADARGSALAEGRAYRFGFVNNTGRFQVAPEEAPCWDTVEQGEAEEEELLRGELPRDILFCLEDSALANVNAPPAAGGSWETGAVYLPDGSAREDVLFTFGKLGLRPQQLQLRGLTGAVNLVDQNSTEGRP